MLSPTSYSASRSIAEAGSPLRESAGESHPPNVASRLFSQSSSQDGGPRRIRAESLFANSCEAADAAANKMLSPLPQALTAKAIAEAIQRYTIKNSARKRHFQEMILSGGGAKKLYPGNDVDRRARPIGLQLRFSDEFGLPSAAKEAVRVRHPGARNLASARLQRAFGNGRKTLSSPR